LLGRGGAANARVEVLSREKKKRRLELGPRASFRAWSRLEVFFSLRDVTRAAAYRLDLTPDAGRCALTKPPTLDTNAWESGTESVSEDSKKSRW